MLYNRRKFLGTLTGGLAAAGIAGPAMSQKADSAAQGTRPNIIWIMAEDISTELACYGHPAVKTPNLDRLAEQGARYTNVFTTAPSCAPARSAMATGMYQTSIDAQHQRSHRSDGYMLPEPVRVFTHYLREAGYFNALGCGYGAKTDFNFTTREKPFDGKDWNQRKPGQPFFAQIQLGCTHRMNKGVWERIRQRSNHPVDPADVELPPYFPDHPACRYDWALYLDQMEYMDGQVGEILRRLDEEGIADNTVVIFIGDNGRCHLRGKCWLYDPGILVPMIIRWPGKLAPGAVCEDLISSIDITATILHMAGVDPPTHLEGRTFLGPDAQPRQHIFAARDRIDEAVDRIRCVRTKSYKYIRNYMPEKGYWEPEYVQTHRPMLQTILKLHDQGKLTPAQELILADRKPDEELYDLRDDPHEIHNLAGSPRHEAVVKKLRALLEQWVKETGETGQYTEKPESLDGGLKYEEVYAAGDHRYWIRDLDAPRP